MSKQLKFFLFFTICSFATCIFLYRCSQEQPKEIKSKSKVLTQREDLPTSDPCEDGSAGNCTGPYSLYTTTVSISDYPGCTFDITYKMRTCPTRKIDIIVLYIDDNDDPSALDPTQCAAFQADIAALDYTTHWVTFELFFDNLENKLGKALALQLGTNQLPPCGGANPPTTISFISGHCNYTCYYRTNEEGGKTKFATTSCGDVCCEQKYEICKDNNNNPVLTKVGSTTPFGNCQPSYFPRECPEYWYYRSTCKEKCRFDF